MDTIKSALNAARAAGEAAVLCAVVERRGSAPRGPGAMMAVTASQVAGTIGGGLVEYEAQQEARRVLETKAFAQRTYRLTNESAADLGMICGGEVTVWFHYLAPAEIPDPAAGRYLTLTEGGGVVVSDHSEPGVHGGRFSVALERPGMVYVFGGGHVSQALVPALARVDFSVTVLEERTEFLTPELFPDAQALIHADYLRLSDFITMTPDDYAVVMTRGHQGDFEILRQLLQSPAAYVGCIGSRKKVAATQARLREAGIDEARIQSLHSPIGLAIGAETPAEIAVSITAQMIAHRAGVAASD